VDDQFHMVLSQQRLLQQAYTAAAAAWVAGRWPIYAVAAALLLCS